MLAHISMIPIPILRIRRTVPTTRVRGASFLEIRMHAGCLGRDAARGVVDQHLFEEIQALVVEFLDEGLRGVALPFGEGGFEVGEAGFVGDAGPFGFGGCS